MLSSSSSLLLGFAALAFTPLTTSAPLYDLSDSLSGPIPGESSIYSTSTSLAAPWPGNITGAILNTTSGPAGADDLLFQNLLAAEWVIFTFYQQAVELFAHTDFTALGRPNTTYARIVQIRDNEAGHLLIFQNSISTSSVKPGPCKYSYGLNASDPTAFLALLTDIEISSMAFLTGLALQAQLDTTKGALVAIGETESRHNTWSLIDVWGADPFAGPSDTVFPYANQILDTTNSFIIPGSCPKENPTYPSPRQSLPTFTGAKGTTSIAPGANVTYSFASSPHGAPKFEEGKDYWAVFFHGMNNVSVPFDTRTASTRIPERFEELGVIISVIASEKGAPTRESVVAGPGIILQQPAAVGLALVG